MGKVRFAPLRAQKTAGLEETCRALVQVLLDPVKPSALKESQLLASSQGIVKECGKRMGYVAFCAILDETAPGVGRAVMRYFQDMATGKAAGKLEGFLRAEGLPLDAQAAFNKAPLRFERVGG